MGQPLNDDAASEEMAPPSPTTSARGPVNMDGTRQEVRGRAEMVPLPQSC